jgi:hypothetical protein
MKRNNSIFASASPRQARFPETKNLWILLMNYEQKIRDPYRQKRERNLRVLSASCFRPRNDSDQIPRDSSTNEDRDELNTDWQ